MRFANDMPEPFPEDMIVCLCGNCHKLYWHNPKQGYLRCAVGHGLIPCCHYGERELLLEDIPEIAELLEELVLCSLLGERK